jgi:hypothetical protein
VQFSAVSDDFVVSIENSHQAGCGSAPRLTKPKGDQKYVGFFESQHGDQFTVEIDRQSKTAVIRSGKLHWARSVAIRENRLQGDVLFRVEEFVWLTACWAAATGEALEYPENFA